MTSHRDSSSVVDLNAPLLAREQRDQPRHHHDNPHPRSSVEPDEHDHDHDGELDLDLELELRGNAGESSGFQPPDRKELATMIISSTVVLILSFAAGLTTVFDWVL